MTNVIFIVFFANLYLAVIVRSQLAPPAITTAWHDLSDGMQKMRQSGKFNYTELVVDLKSFVGSVVSSVQNPSKQLQNQVMKIQSGIQAATASGSPDPNLVRAAIQSAFDVINNNYPTLKRNAKVF